MYPNEEITNYVSSNFLPVKIHIKEQPAVFERFRVQWTPTLLVVDQDGVERHRFEGFLPVQDFKLQLALGLAHTAFGRKEWAGAESRYRDLVQRFPDSESAPEALYWAGVSKYKASGEPSALSETARQFQQRYPGSSWAKKASVWSS